MEFSFYDLATGLFNGHRRMCTQAEAEAIATAAGLGVIEGAHDHLSARVDLEAGTVVDWQPDPPADTELQTWAWSEVARRWIPSPTLAARTAAAKVERARRLAACDWVVARSLELAEPVPTAWAAYRQALRDLPGAEGFPDVIVWPDPPA